MAPFATLAAVSLELLSSVFALSFLSFSSRILSSFEYLGFGVGPALFRRVSCLLTEFTPGLVSSYSADFHGGSLRITLDMFGFEVVHDL